METAESRWHSSPACLEWLSKLNRNVRGYVLGVPLRFLQHNRGGRPSSSQPPLPLSFLLPDNNRQFLALTARDGTPLTILSSTASATFPLIDLSQNTSPVRREIKGVQVQQQGSHALLVIFLRVNSTDSQVALAYQTSLLAGPVAR